MVLITTPEATIGSKAPDFRLLGIDGRYYSFSDIKGKNGTIVVFICNHCPFVKAIIDKLTNDFQLLQKKEIRCVAISANDAVAFPEDSYDNMKVFAKEHSFTFPYLYDETQEVAKAYNAVCTPDFFGFNNKDELQYRGRFDSSGMNKNEHPKHELYEAMLEISANGKYSQAQSPSIGCSMKWKLSL